MEIDEMDHNSGLSSHVAHACSWWWNLMTCLVVFDGWMDIDRVAGSAVPWHGRPGMVKVSLYLSLQRCIMRTCSAGGYVYGSIYLEIMGGRRCGDGACCQCQLPTTQRQLTYQPCMIIAVCGCAIIHVPAQLRMNRRKKNPKPIKRKINVRSVSTRTRRACSLARQTSQQPNSSRRSEFTRYNITYLPLDEKRYRIKRNPRYRSTKFMVGVLLNTDSYMLHV